MTTEVLKEKTGRYLSGHSVPAEAKQIQTWLSCTDEKKNNISEKERVAIEEGIIAQIQAYVASSSLQPKVAASWWKKIKVF